MTVVTFAPFQSTSSHPALGTRGHAGSERQTSRASLGQLHLSGLHPVAAIRSNATGTVVLVDQVTNRVEDPLPREHVMGTVVTFDVYQASSLTKA